MALSGLMQHPGLTIGRLIDHAAKYHADREILSVSASGDLERVNWAAISHEARKIASLLNEMGLVEGDRVATLAWNRRSHLALYFGVASSGRVLHTVNPRLHADQLTYVLNHGGSQIVCVEPDMLQVLLGVIDDLPKIRTILVLGEADGVIDRVGVEILDYKTALDFAEPLSDWPELDENIASSLCYTSGTTGNPKGVLYSHRSTILHAFSACAADAMALSARDTALLVTPLFHVNAWGVPFAAAMCGAKLVLPGPDVSPNAIRNLIAAEDVTFTLGVPTIWLGMIEFLKSQEGANEDFKSLERIFIGGSAPPRSLIADLQEMLGVRVVQAWGMTETSPVATVCSPLAKHASLTSEQNLDLSAKQGRPLFGVDVKVAPDGEQSRPLNDGVDSGRLFVRGDWVLRGYFGSDQPATDEDGWFDTGDVATLDADGYVSITDRAKDLIKSGGEWISSVELESAALSLDGVVAAAVIAAAHKKWEERPLLIVKLRDAIELSADEIKSHIAQRVAKWWVPDDVIELDEFPYTATGKIYKMALREKYSTHYLDNHGR